MHVEQAEIFGADTIISFGLNINLPLTAKAVEVIDERAAHEGLERLIDFTQVHALLEGLVAIHMDENLRHDRQESSAEAGQFRALARGFEKLIQVVIEELQVPAGPVLQDEGKTSGRAYALNGWG